MLDVLANAALEGLDGYESLAMEEVQRSKDPAYRQKLGEQAERLVPLLKQLGASNPGRCKQCEQA